MPNASMIYHVEDCPRLLKKAGNSLLFQNTHSAAVPGRGNAFCLRHVSDARHVGDGRVYPVFIWIRHNRTHFSQSERLLVKPKRPCTDLCAEPVGVWNRLSNGENHQCFRLLRINLNTNTIEHTIHLKLCSLKLLVTNYFWMAFEDRHKNFIRNKPKSSQNPIWRRWR